MVKMLIVHWSHPQYRRAAFSNHLHSYERYSDARCLYLDARRTRVPHYIRRFEPDLVVFQSTFFMPRANETEFSRMLDLVGWLRDPDVPKVIIAADEQFRNDQLVRFINNFHVSHVFSFASPEARQMIYDGADPTTQFIDALSGYVDPRLLKRIERLRAGRTKRSIDVGGRFVHWPSLGRTGYLKVEMATAFLESTPNAGLTADISLRREDVLFGEAWFKFLLSCRWVIGVESGASILDGDGSIERAISTYLTRNPSATFEEISEHCYRGRDGEFDYRALACRHIDAVITKTGQVLLEGHYNGVLRANDHYVELKRDFSNLDHVLTQMQDEGLRCAMVERAYDDIVRSGRYSYETFVNTVLNSALGPETGVTPHSSSHFIWRIRNRLGERLVLPLSQLSQWWQSKPIRRVLRRMIVLVFGESRLQTTLARLRRQVRD